MKALFLSSAAAFATLLVTPLSRAGDPISSVAPVAADISGKYEAIATVVTRPQNSSRGQVSLAGLMLAGMPDLRIVTMQIRQTGSEITFTYYSAEGHVLLKDRVGSAEGFRSTPENVTFKRIFRTTNEAGRVIAEDAYSFTNIGSGGLQLDVVYSTVAGLIFRSRSEALGSYRFRRLL